MAYTSVVPVYHLKRSVEYVADKNKTTQKTARTLEDAIDYALNRDKTERVCYEDAVGCTVGHAYEDMVQTKERFRKLEGVQGYHLIQSFAKGEVRMYISSVWNRL